MDLLHCIISKQTAKRLSTDLENRRKINAAINVSHNTHKSSFKPNESLCKVWKQLETI